MTWGSAMRPTGARISLAVDSLLYNNSCWVDHRKSLLQEVQIEEKLLHGFEGGPRFFETQVIGGNAPTGSRHDHIIAGGPKFLFF